MTLYRALYQIQANGRVRGMTFAAQSAERAARIAEDWQLPGDVLLTVKPLRPMQAELHLVAA